MAIAKAQVVKGCAVSALKLTGSSTWDVTGGFFCNINATGGTADMTVAADTVVSGFVDLAPVGADDSNVSSNVLTVPASPGNKYKFNFYGPYDLVVRMPVKSGTTVTAAYGGKLVDLDVTTSKQTVDIDSTSTEVVQILPVSQEDIDTNTVRVVINPAKVGR